MYYPYFGLTEPPFSIAVNPRYLFMSDRHRDALAHLLYGVGEGGGFILLTGEVGTGKTTINRCLLEQLPQDTDIAIILNPALNAQELLATACDELGIEYPKPDPSLKTLTDSLHQYLLDNHAAGRKTVLLIDEAQHLNFDVLEQIRLLTNLETNSQKLLQIILIGQPELSQMLARPELRQLNQRITARYNLEPLNPQETGAYIHHRLQVAGMSPDRTLFGPQVVRQIYRLTGGIPRVINVLCDRALLGAYGRNKQRVDMAMLRQAATEVLGPEKGRAVGGAWDAGRRLWPLAAAAALLIAGGLSWQAGLWPMLGTEDNAKGVTAPQIQAPAVVATPAAGTAPPAVSPPTPSAVAPRPTQAPPTSPVPAEGPVAEAASDVASTNTLVGDPSDVLISAMQPPDDAMAQLWRLTTEVVAPSTLCPQVRIQGMTCMRGETDNFSDLARLNRALYLDVLTPQRFAAGILVLEFVGDHAWVATPDGPEWVPLITLAEHWSGGYRMLWRRPGGYRAPLALGTEGRAVAEVAQLFAQLDVQSRPLTDGLFNAPLQQRVRLFQSNQGLSSDGVVGLRTLLKLNEALGLAVVAQEARLRAAGAADR